MSRWFRFYDDAINDPKLLKLPDDLYRAWTILLCVASKHGGVLPSAEDIALSLRLKTAKVAEWLTKLVRAGLIDHEAGVFSPHNWNGRQYKSDDSKERVQRYRKRQCNGDSNGDVTVTVTPPEQIQKTDTEAEKKKTREVALDGGWPSDFRVLFWEAWPNKVGKPKALMKLERIRRRGVSWVILMDGVDRYKRTKPPERSWMNPETFLNGERWNDQPAEVTSGKSESLASVAKRQADAGISFGPRPTGLRLVEGRDDVRLLPEAGRERPGDLRGGGDGDLVGVSGFGD